MLIWKEELLAKVRMTILWRNQKEVGRCGGEAPHGQTNSRSDDQEPHERQRRTGLRNKIKSIPNKKARTGRAILVPGTVRAILQTASIGLNHRVPYSMCGDGKGRLHKLALGNFLWVAKCKCCRSDALIREAAFAPWLCVPLKI